MPRFILYNTVRGLHYVSRQSNLEKAIAEWIDKELRYKYKGIKVKLSRLREYTVPNTGNGSLSIDNGITILFEWKIVEDNMQLTIKQLCKPIDCYVVMMDFYSEIDNRKIGSEPVGVWFERDLAEKFCESMKLESYIKARVATVVTTGVTGLQSVIDRITTEVE